MKSVSSQSFADSKGVITSIDFGGAIARPSVPAIDRKYRPSRSGDVPKQIYTIASTANLGKKRRRGDIDEMSSEDERWMIFALLDHLQKATTKADAKTEPLQEAMFALSNAYNMNMHSSASKLKYELSHHSLVDIVKAGRQALRPGTSPATTATAAIATATVVTASPENGSGSDDPGFARFVQRLRDTTAFFNGVTEGTPEFNDRLSHARAKYDARIISKKQRVENPSSATADAADAADAATSTSLQTRSMLASTSASASKPSVDAMAQASKIKERGNAELKAKRHEEALNSYTECIALDGGNAVYFSNRAAAKILLSRFSEAVDDCKQAIALDANFLRPWERLASAYRYLGMTKKEIEALRGALALDGTNETFKALLREAEQKLAGEGGVHGGNETNAGMLNRMAQSMGFNVPEEVVQSFANSDMMNQFGNMAGDNPAMMDQMMRAVGSAINANSFSNPAGGGGGGSGGGGNNGQT